MFLLLFMSLLPNFGHISDEQLFTFLKIKTELESFSIPNLYFSEKFDKIAIFKDNHEQNIQKVFRFHVQ